MINVTFHDYKKLSCVFTRLRVLVCVASLSNLVDVSIKIKFFKVLVYKLSIHFSER